MRTINTLRVVVAFFATAALFCSCSDGLNEPDRCDCVCHKAGVPMRFPDGEWMCDCGGHVRFEVNGKYISAKWFELNGLNKAIGEYTYNGQSMSIGELTISDIVWANDSTFCCIVNKETTITTITKQN